jgi:peptide/nickel transport system permease protein
MQAAPGDVAEMLISSQGEMQAGDRQARLEYIRERYGLDAPVGVQYVRWLHKISPVGVFSEADDGIDGWGVPVGKTEEGDTRRLGFKEPDLGHSFIKNRPVLDLISESLPITILLNALALPVVYLLAVVSGVYAGRRRAGVFDVTSGLLMLVLWSIPTIWAGTMLQGFLANRNFLSLFPTSGLHGLNADHMPFLPRWGEAGFQPGWLLDAVWHMVLPVACLGYTAYAFMGKLARSAVLENIHSDYVRTARSKGLEEKYVLWRHAFRNSLLPLITVAAFIIPGMLSGSIVVEYIFSIHGMGRMAIEAIKFKDQEVVMAITLITGLLSLLAFLIADVMYALADPRVAYD